MLLIITYDTGCSLNIVLFPKNSRKSTTSSSPALGCYCSTKNYQPIVTVHSHCVESFEGLLQQCRRRRGCSELRKTQFFPNTLYLSPLNDEKRAPQRRISPYNMMQWSPLSCPFFELSMKMILGAKQLLQITLSIRSI